MANRDTYSIISGGLVDQIYPLQPQPGEMCLLSLLVLKLLLNGSVRPGITHAFAVGTDIALPEATQAQSFKVNAANVPVRSEDRIDDSVENSIVRLQAETGDYRKNDNRGYATMLKVVGKGGVISKYSEVGGEATKDSNNQKIVRLNPALRKDSKFILFGKHSNKEASKDSGPGLNRYLTYSGTNHTNNEPDKTDSEIKYYINEEGHMKTRRLKDAMLDLLANVSNTRDLKQFQDKPMKDGDKLTFTGKNDRGRYRRGYVYRGNYYLDRHLAQKRQMDNIYEVKREKRNAITPSKRQTVKEMEQGDHDITRNNGYALSAIFKLWDNNSAMSTYNVNNQSATSDFGQATVVEKARQKSNLTVLKKHQTSKSESKQTRSRRALSKHHRKFSNRGEKNEERHEEEKLEEEVHDAALSKRAFDDYDSSDLGKKMATLIA